MATIMYSTSGEGRGHATRVRAMTEMLRRDHRVAIFAPGDAWELLAPAYAGSDVEVHEIPGLRFAYTSRRRMAIAPTARHTARYVRRFPSLTREIEAAMDRLEPDLVLTDFEPSLPWVARRRGIPFVSIDHQHFLLACDLQGLPRRLRVAARGMGVVVAAYYRGQAHTVVSSFYRLPLKPRARRTTAVGPLLRPELLKADTEPGDHLVAYLRRFGSPAVLEALSGCGREVRVYGLGERPPSGRLRFCGLDEARFVHDLATSAALVSTAGNQLVGEALFLGKPVFALPEAGNSEQFINAHFLAASGCGTWRPLETVRTEDLLGFLERLELLRPRTRAVCRPGNRDTLAVVQRHLPAADPALAVPPRRRRVAAMERAWS